LRGQATVDAWQAQVLQGQTVAVVQDLLTRHYDPVYASSIRRNFLHYGNAVACVLPDRSAEALTALARQLVAADAMAQPISVA